MNQKLYKAVIAGFGILALAGVSTQASAVTVNNVGGGSGVINSAPSSLTSISASNTGAFGWDGQNNGTAGAASKNYGWAHSARWFTFSVANSAGAYGVDINVTDTNGSTTSPAFSVWQTTGNFVGGNHSSGSYGQRGMSFNQVADQTAIANTWLAVGGSGPASSTNGVTAFVGYANAGSSFINGAGTSVGTGGFGAGFSGSYAGTVAGSVANLKLDSLSNGQYLIALGGSCNAGGCGSLAYNLTVAAVPEPEEYLMMLMGAGMVGFQVKRKQAKQPIAA
jgi:hypothetical protein